VRAAAADLQRLPRIDYLILNAGVMVGGIQLKGLNLHWGIASTAAPAGQLSVSVQHDGPDRSSNVRKTSCCSSIETCQFHLQGTKHSHTKDGFEMQLGAIRSFTRARSSNLLPHHQLA
jgi:hypothetical protein